MGWAVPWMESDHGRRCDWHSTFNPFPSFFFFLLSFVGLLGAKALSWLPPYPCRYLAQFCAQWVWVLEASSRDNFLLQGSADRLVQLQGRRNGFENRSHYHFSFQNSPIIFPRVGSNFPPFRFFPYSALQQWAGELTGQRGLASLTSFLPPGEVADVYSVTYLVLGTFLGLI